MSGALAPDRVVEPADAGHSDRILLVEDDKVIAALSARVLMRSGFVVDTAPDGLTGLTVLHRQNYDLVITDNRLPGITGLEMVSRLRHEHNEVPVVLASGNIEDEEVMNDPLLRISATLPKPFTLDQLVVTVKSVLSHRHVVANAPAADARRTPLAETQGIQRWGINE